MRITCQQSALIGLDRPTALLSHDIVTGHFAGRPTLIINAATLEERYNPVLETSAKQVRQMIGKVPTLRSDFKRAGTSPCGDNVAQVVAMHMNALRKSVYADGKVMPAILMDRDLITVTAPGENYRIDRLISGHIIAMEAPLHKTELTMATRYQALCHKLAHAADADEPQADYAAAMLTKRAFGPAAACVNVMMADMRAALAVDCAAQTADPDNDAARFYMEEYGWAMVMADDRAHSANNNENPEETGFKRITFRDDGVAVTALAELLARAAGLQPGVLCAGDDVRAACANADSEIRDKGMRYALAVDRLRGGHAAYGV